MTGEEAAEAQRDDVLISLRMLEETDAATCSDRALLRKIGNNGSGSARPAVLRKAPCRREGEEW